MDTTVKLRLLNLLKVLTALSFLFIDIDNGKFVVPMWLVVLGSFAFLAAPSWEELAHLLLPLSLLTLFVPAVGKINHDRAMMSCNSCTATIRSLISWAGGSLKNIIPSAKNGCWASAVLPPKSGTIPYLSRIPKSYNAAQINI